jgi:PHD/YefM family antitoxin component YafN of YafNO toxin-antitoxin module
MTQGLGAIPLIDPTVKHVGVSKLRELNATKLKEQHGDTLVIQDNDQPLAVLLSYEKYLIIQEQLAAVMNTLELFSESAELEGVLRGLNEVAEGRTRTFAEVRAALKKKHATKVPQTSEGKASAG